MNQENISTPESGTAGNDQEQEFSVTVDLQAEIEALQAQLQELRNDYLRAQADVQNIRRRADEEVAKSRKFAVESFAESLLPVCDSLHAAIAAQSAGQGTPEQLLDMQKKEK